MVVSPSKSGGRVRARMEDKGAMRSGALFAARVRISIDIAERLPLMAPFSAESCESSERRCVEECMFVALLVVWASS